MGATAAERFEVERRPSQPTPGSDPTTIFQGSLRDVNVVGLLQSLELNQATASVRVEGPRQRGRVWLRDGRICHAVLGRATGAEAVYRMICIDDGGFRVEFGDAREDEATIAGSNTGLFMEGVRRRDHLVHLLSDLPDPSSYLQWTHAAADMTPPQLAIVSSCDGTKTLGDLLDAAPDALQAATDLHQLWKSQAVKVVEVRVDADPSHEDDVEPPAVTKKKGPRYFRAAVLGAIIGTASSFAMVSWKPEWARMMPTANALGPLCPTQTVAVDGSCVDVHPVSSQAYAACVDEQRCDPDDGGGLSLAQADQYCAFAGGELATQAQWDQATTQHGLQPSPVGIRCVHRP